MMGSYLQLEYIVHRLEVTNRHFLHNVLLHLE